MDLDQIEQALSSPHPFGDVDRTEQRRRYRQMARILHPDTRSGVDDVRADALFRRLEASWSALNSPRPAVSRWEISTKRNHYLVTGSLGSAGCSNEYAVTWMSSGDQCHGLLRLPRSPRDNDLIDAEIKALKQIATDVEDRYRAYFPQLVDVFRHRDATTRADRRGLILTEHPSGVISLDLLHQKIPVLNPRDMAWIFRRLLTAIGAGHQTGLVNGAILPEHVLIQPVDHGVILPVWQYSSTESPIRAIPTGRRDWYPSEVLEKKHPSEATDLYMAAKLHEHMTGYVPGTEGRSLRAFMASCMAGSQRNRPDDAWKLLGEYDDLIERLWGPRTFRILDIPN